MSIWLIVSLAALLVQTIYWIALARGFARSRNTRTESTELVPVSVIVAARNEAQRLPGLLAALAGQSSTDFEILVVDDGSTDATPAILSRHAEKNPASAFRVVRITDPTQPRKKNALTKAIDLARHDRLLFTDADCLPGPDWVAGMSAHLAANSNTVIVGYSPFETRSGLLNLLARYETFITGYFTAATIGLGRPYMAVGRNMAYTRAVFHRVDGFAHSANLLSGDDDLFVQEVVRKQAAAVVHATDSATFVESEAPRTWVEWFSHKTRHASAGTAYDPSVKRHLATYHVSAIAMWLIPIVGGWPCVAVLVFRQIIQFVALRAGARGLHEQDLLAYQPLLELGYVAYNLIVAPVGLIRKRVRW